MLYIVFLSAFVFLIHMMDRTNTFLTFLLFLPDRILRGEIWRLFTWVLLPTNPNPLFVMITLYFYYFIGSTLEREWGTARFTIYYIFGILSNIIFGIIMWYILGGIAFIFPTFLNLSMFFAFAALFPDNMVRLFFIIPIKIKWMALINAGFFIYSIIDGMLQGQITLALLPLVALMNFFLICGKDVLSHLKPLKARTSAQAINFRKAAKKTQREKNEAPYRHKCAVCGRTDSDYPGLEFRYCSRCEGYHCFCIDHINNHVHFQ